MIERHERYNWARKFYADFPVLKLDLETPKTPEEVRAELEELIKKIDIGTCLIKFAKAIKYNDMFPKLYQEGEKVPKRYGFSGEEI